MHEVLHGHHTLPNAHYLHARVLCSTHTQHFCQLGHFYCATITSLTETCAVDSCVPDTDSAVAVHHCIKTICQIAIVGSCCQLSSAHMAAAWVCSGGCWSFNINFLPAHVQEHDCSVAALALSALCEDQYMKVMQKAISDFICATEAFAT